MTEVWSFEIYYLLVSSQLIVYTGVLSPVNMDCAVFHVPQHSIGYMGDGFYRSKGPNQQYQSTEGRSTKDKANNENN